MESDLQLLLNIWRISYAEHVGRIPFRHPQHGMLCDVLLSYGTQRELYRYQQGCILCPALPGSPYAVVHLVKGDGGPKSFLSKKFGRSEDIRKVVRTYPALLELAPWYPGSMAYEDGTPWILRIWWLAIQHMDDIENLFRARLTALADFRNNHMCDLSKLPEDLRSRMIIIAGSNDNTLIGLKADKLNGPWRIITAGRPGNRFRWRHCTVWQFNDF